MREEIKAFATLQRYCIKHGHCNGCIFKNKDNECKFEKAPALWGDMEVALNYKSVPNIRSWDN